MTFFKVYLFYYKLLCNALALINRCKIAPGAALSAMRFTTRRGAPFRSNGLKTTRRKVGNKAGVPLEVNIRYK